MHLQNTTQNIHNILVITILGAICDAETWIEMCAFAEAKYDWLKTFLALPNETPSPDTFERIFSSINPNIFEEKVSAWIASLTIDIPTETIIIDGKNALTPFFLDASLADNNQIGIEHAVKNLAIIKRIALNLLKQEKTHKNGIACRRKRAGWDNKYLLKVLEVGKALTKVENRAELS